MRIWMVLPFLAFLAVSAADSSNGSLRLQQDPFHSSSKKSNNYFQGKSKSKKPYRREFKFQGISTVWYKWPQAVEIVQERLEDFLWDTCQDLIGESDAGIGPCNGSSSWWKHPWDSYHRYCAEAHYSFDAPETEEGRLCLHDLDRELEGRFLELQEDFKDNTTLTWINTPQYPTDGAFFTFNVTLLTPTGATSSSDGDDYDPDPWGPFDDASEEIMDALWQAFVDHGHGFADSPSAELGWNRDDTSDGGRTTLMMGDVYSGVQNTVTEVQDLVWHTLHNFKTTNFTVSNVTLEQVAEELSTLAQY